MTTAKTVQPILTIEPMYLQKEHAAAFLSLKETTFDELVASGEIPRPRQISRGRVGWLVEDLKAYGRSRPVSSMLPPKGSGYGRAGKPPAAASPSR